MSHGCENTHKYFVILKIEKVDMSAGKSKKLFFSPKCKLFLPFVSIFSFTLSSAEQMQTAGWPGWDVSYKEQRLIADSADKINFGPGKKKMTEGHKVYSPHRLSRSPSFCLLSLRPLYFKRLPIYTDDNDVGWHNTAVVKLEDILGLLRPDGLQWKGGERYQVHPVLTSHNVVQDLRTM